MRVDTRGDWPVARLAGELRAESGAAIGEELHPLVAENGRRLILDLSDLDWVDSGGLSHLISLVTHSRLAGARVILVHPGRYVAGVLEVTQLDQWFEIADSIDAAMQAAG